jgi:hypothetical protein
MTGFADKKHTNAPCPKCNVTQADLFSDKANRNGALFLLCIYAISAHSDKDLMLGMVKLIVANALNIKP